LFWIIWKSLHPFCFVLAFLTSSQTCSPSEGRVPPGRHTSRRVFLIAIYSFRVELSKGRLFFFLCVGLLDWIINNFLFLISTNVHATADPSFVWWIALSGKSWCVWLFNLSPLMRLCLKSWKIRVWFLSCCPLTPNKTHFHHILFQVIGSPAQSFLHSPQLFILRVGHILTAWFEMPIDGCEMAALCCIDHIRRENCMWLSILDVKLSEAFMWNLINMHDNTLKNRKSFFFLVWPQHDFDSVKYNYVSYCPFSPAMGN